MQDFTTHLLLCQTSLYVYLVPNVEKYFQRIKKEVFVMPKKAKTTKKSAGSDSTKKVVEKEAVGTR